MRKNRIRLSESQLRRVIKESVRQMLSEADWKTFYKAAKEDTYANNGRELGDKKRNRNWRFNDAAQRAFERDFGFKNGNGRITVHQTRSDWDNMPGLMVDYSDNNGESFEYPKHFITDGNFYGQNGQHAPGKWCVGTVTWCGEVPCSPDFDTEEEAKAYADEKGWRTERMTPDEDILNAYKKAKEEIDNFDNGNYDYDDKRGWYLKGDSKLDESIKRSIRKYLR